MKNISVLRMMCGFHNKTLNEEHEVLSREGASYNLSQKDQVESVEALSIIIPDNKVVQDKDKTNEEKSTKNINNMLSTKSELLKEGKEIVEQIQNLNDGRDLNYSPKRKENETDDEYEYRKQQCQLLYDRYRDWAEYARLYIYRNQIIPTHYNEFMTEYHRLNKGLWFVKKSLRIIETCE